MIRKARDDDFYKTFVDMQREIDNVFSGFLGGGYPVSARGSRIPSVDVYENEKEYVFEFELPGLKKEDIKVSVDENILTVESVKKEEKEEKNKDYHIVERKCGCFKRQFTLPENTEKENIGAKYENGVLELKLPKKEKTKPQAIEINVG
jgi:HSP20 family protein